MPWGLAGIFLNIESRETRRHVSKRGVEADTLRNELCEKLSGLIDPRHDAVAIKQGRYNSRKCYVGPYKNEAPDLVVGYNEG